MQPFTLADIGLNKEKVTLFSSEFDESNEMFEISNDFAVQSRELFFEAFAPLQKALNINDPVEFEKEVRPYIHYITSSAGAMLCVYPPDFKFQSIRELLYVYSGATRIIADIAGWIKDHPWKMSVCVKLQKELQMPIEKQK